MKNINNNLIIKIKKIIQSNIEIVFKEKLNISEILIFCNIKNNINGHFYSNFLLLLKQKNIENFHQKIKLLLLSLSNDNTFSKVEEKNLFINFFINKSSFYNMSKLLNNNNYDFKLIEKASDKKIYNIEFVSANPTGNLHIGHLRNGIFGDILSNIIKEYGHNVIKEYVINNGGKQVDDFVTSIWVQYLRNLNLVNHKDYNIKIQYKNETINENSNLLIKLFNDKLKKYQINDLVDDEKIINIFKENFDYDNKKLFKLSLLKIFIICFINYTMDFIKKELLSIGIKFDVFTKESKFYENNAIINVLKLFQKNNMSYKQDGAVWLKTTKFGDEKDRVIVKSSGLYTYILPDIVYHKDKLSRSNYLINIWGADHHDQASRIKYGLSAIGLDENKLKVILLQMVQLEKANLKFKMSKRSGNVITTKDLLSVLDKDLIRYYLIYKSSDSHIKINVEKVKEKNTVNKFYYFQYCYARCYSLFDKSDFSINELKSNENFNLLNNDIEFSIIKYMNYFNNIFEKSFLKQQPHILTNYLDSLSKLFHNYYNNIKIISENKELTKQRLSFLYSLTKLIDFICHKLLDIKTIKKI